MNKRERMRASNRLVRQWLLENGYDQIWFKRHGKRNDYVFTKNGSCYMAQDIWNLFDGIAINSQGCVSFLQMSTTQWHPRKRYEDFARKTRGVEPSCLTWRRLLI